MEKEITAALIGALGGAVVALLGHRFQRKRDVRLKAEKAQALFSKYREPLSHACFELQSKLYNILKLGLLKSYYIEGNQNEKEYSVQHTLFVIAQFLAWNEIILREIQFLDVGEVEATRKLSDLNEKIVVSFLTSEHGKVFRIFRGEQRAIAEKMIRSENGRLSCIGYASFVEAREKDFRRWFNQLEKDIDVLAENSANHSERLVQLQHALIDLLDYLDPDCVRFASQYRTKV